MFRHLPKLARHWRVSTTGLVLLAGSGGICQTAHALTFIKAVEPPPARYASGPTQTGRTTELTFSTPEALEDFCNRHLGRPPQGYYEACYIPALDLVVLPDGHAWPSARERAELKAHEWAHARGWRHPAPHVETASSNPRGASPGE